MKIKSNKPIEYKKALIYCRVSSERQVNEGHGLDSQEQRCVNHALSLNLDVEEIYRDEGVSGSLFERPAMRRLLSYLDKHSENNYTVIFDDLKRFARDVPTHLQLKVELVSKRKSEITVS